MNLYHNFEIIGAENNWLIARRKEVGYINFDLPVNSHGENPEKPIKLGLNNCIWPVSGDRFRRCRPIVTIRQADLLVKSKLTLNLFSPLTYVLLCGGCLVGIIIVILIARLNSGKK